MRSGWREREMFNVRKVKEEKKKEAGKRKGRGEEDEPWRENQCNDEKVKLKRYKTEKKKR